MDELRLIIPEISDMYLKVNQMINEAILTIFSA